MKHMGPREVDGLCWPQDQLGAALGHVCPGPLFFLLPSLISLLLIMTLENLFMSENLLLGESISSMATAKWSLIKH